MHCAIEYIRKFICCDCDPIKSFINRLRGASFQCFFPFNVNRIECQFLMGPNMFGTEYRHFILLFSRLEMFNHQGENTGRGILVKLNYRIIILKL